MAFPQCNSSWHMSSVITIAVHLMLSVKRINDANHDVFWQYDEYDYCVANAQLQFELHRLRDT